MVERALLYAAEIAVATYGRVRRRAGGFVGFVVETRAVAARVYIELLDRDEPDDDVIYW
jgi:hypothetical protein